MYSFSVMDLFHEYEFSKLMDGSDIAIDLQIA